MVVYLVYGYNERDKFWKNYCGNLGLYKSGYYAATNQINLSVKLTYGNQKSLDNHFKQITELLPHIKSQDDGYKHFDIFEHTLSRGCSYKLLINEKEYIISAGCWSKEKFKDLKSALEYIQTNHWYDGKEESED